MNLSTKITLARIILVPVFVALFLIEFPYHYFCATAAFIIASLTDFLDGHLARKYNLVTDLANFWIRLQIKLWFVRRLFWLLLFKIHSRFS